jgi:predicted SAM-dependent methyltransferase
MKQVLEIGANVKAQANLFVPDAQYFTLDVDEKLKPDFVCDAASMPKDWDNKWDAIVASHVLEHFSYWKEQDVLKEWMRCLKPGGELHILVPSAEWAAREVLSDKPSPALHGHMLAGQINQWDVHLNIFTMRKLRALFERVGFTVTRARSGQYGVVYGGKEWPCEQHYICGVKGVPELKKE